jgi:NAD+ kinase
MSDGQMITGLNEITVRCDYAHAAHLNIFIDDSFIEKFSGDGILVSTPAGSTAYNYALGGDIVDPRIEVLQLTPIAPISSSAYRSFTSGVLLPPDLNIRIVPEHSEDETLLIAADGKETEIKGVGEITIGFASTDITLLRFKDLDFWTTVKNKLL